ncbi:hypothetical protein ACFSC6_20620 [Rufibacter sediminis]|uniref:Lipoprotein n=1 Tax=Rufibacter sediminis TaxID=2762756 RepID=A0ABR6VPI8_9BACT|nr:hypothetical protein [Rufibacter sediminis]MBC3539104.1 hypothetical protein [Rufibacter sediminis]
MTKRKDAILPILLLFRQQLFQRILSGLLLLSFLPLAISCNYYRLKEENAVSQEKLASLPNYKRFILRQGDNALELKEIALQENTLTGTVHPIPVELMPFIDKKPGSTYRYKKINEGVALNIVHLYVNEYAQSDNKVSIPVSSIKRIDVSDKDTGATIASHVLGSIGIAAGAFALISIIAVLLKSSCPFIYVKDGTGYHFVGEAYGGAIFAPLERDDYMPLPTPASSAKQVQVKITNELKERQYTNLAELLVVEHAPGVQVLLDQQGNAHSLQQVIPPHTVMASDGREYTSLLASQDSAVWSFNDAAPKMNFVDLQFKKPSGSQTGKLLLYAQNSLWLDYLYDEFTKQFKGIYNHWAEKQKDVPASELYQWQREQGIPLLVEVKTAKGWKTVDRIHPVGPLASRDLVVSIPLAEVPGENVQVRLSCGFMFWEIDRAGMDFTSNQTMTMQKIAAAQAYEKSGQNVRSLLATSDSSYLHQFSVGDAVALTFLLPEKGKGNVQATFLHTRGYYEHIREYSGIPNLVSLRAFEKPGHFYLFSRQRYTQLAEENNFPNLLTAHATTR